MPWPKAKGSATPPVADFKHPRDEFHYLASVVLGPDVDPERILEGIDAAAFDALAASGAQAFDSALPQLVTDDLLHYMLGDSAPGRFRVRLEDFVTWRDRELWLDTIRYVATKQGRNLVGVEAYRAPGFLPFDPVTVAIAMLRIAARRGPNTD